MSSAFERIEAFKQKLRDSNPSCISSDSNPTPLETYLHILEGAGSASFRDFCKGAKCLHRWLTNNGTVPLVFRYPDTCKVPRLATGYLTYEIAKIIAGPEKDYPSFEVYLKDIDYIVASIHYIHINNGYYN